jgi:hypothetical protein
MFPSGQTCGNPSNWKRLNLTHTPKRENKLSKNIIFEKSLNNKSINFLNDNHRIVFIAPSKIFTKYVPEAVFTKKFTQIIVHAFLNIPN